MSRTGRWLVSLLSCGATLAGTAFVAGATTPGTNGRIVFTGNVGAGTQLFSMKPDGTEIVQLTHVPESRERASGGAWSPNGRLIAFNGEFSNHASVYVIRADGSHMRRACPPRFNFCGNNASWAPSGKALVTPGLRLDRSRSSCNQGLRLIAIDGRLIRTLTRHAGAQCANEHWDIQPTFSPDGRRIAFRANRGMAGAICVIDASGRHRRCLTRFADDDGWPVWSPDGARILFEADINNARPGVTANLFTIRPDGTGLTQITQLAGAGVYAGKGSWSPDGTQIVYRRGGPGDATDLFVLNADGTGERQLTQLGPGVHAASPDWGTNPR